MDINDIKSDFDKDYTSNQDSREKGSDDLVFYYITQWDDNLLGATSLSYRGEFNILKRAAREIMTDLRQNPVQPDFHPIGETKEDDAELMDGLYRSDDRRNSTQEAYFVAQQEAVVCGVGAWELFTEYESLRSGDTRQVIKRRPIHEANNLVFWDSNSKMQDKSDAMRCAILTPYTVEAYEDLVKELTGDDDYKASASSFKSPAQSYVFPWVLGNMKAIYVATVYKRKLVKDKVLTLVDPMTGTEVTQFESKLDDVMDDYIDAGYTIADEKKIERYEVTKYICSGEKVLKEYAIAGDMIPVVPAYGERAIVEGQEHWEGVTRLAKDPQRLHNFVMSYMADIASKSPLPKPIFYAESVAGLEKFFDGSGMYPYSLVNRYDDNGQELPLQSGILPESTVPAAVTNLAALSRQAMGDVAGTGGDIDMTDMDLSGEAVKQLEKRIKIQSALYQENLKHAKKRDAEIYVGMVRDVYDVPRKTYVTNPDGSRKEVVIQQTVIDAESGDVKVLNDLSNVEFEVYADVQPTYNTVVEQTRKELREQIMIMQPDDPMRPIYQLELAALFDGATGKTIRDYARKQMIINGFKEPETDEEMQMMQEAQQQGQEPDAAMLLAQAEVMKGEASMLREQREAQKDQNDLQMANVDKSIDMYNAQTGRMKAEVDAKAKQAKIRLDTAASMASGYKQLRGSVG